MARSRVLALTACLIGTAAPAAASAATPAQIADAMALGTSWLRAQQDPTTGTIPGFGGDWSLSALAQAGVDPGSWGSSPSAQDAWLAEWTGPSWLTPIDPDTGYNPAFLGASDFARATLLAHAAGLQPSRLSADQNLVAQLAAAWRNDGQYGTTGLNGAMFALMALAGEGTPRAVLDKTVQLIRDNVHDDGGWTYSLASTPAQKATASDVDMTGAGIAALCSAGVPASDPTVEAALSFVHGAQAADGGFASRFFGVNADTTAWVLAGLNACGIDPQSPAWTNSAGKTALDAVIGLQRTTGPEAGSFRWQPSESASASPNLYASQESVRALAGGVFSAAPLSVRPAPTVADGTPVPSALAIDAGDGNVRFCRVVAPTGTSVAALLTIAQTTAQPSDCVRGLVIGDGEVAALNGVTPAVGQRWVASLDGGAAANAGRQPVGFGQLVSLTIAPDLSPGAGGASVGAVTPSPSVAPPAPEQPATTSGAPAPAPTPTPALAPAEAPSAARTTTARHRAQIVRRTRHNGRLVVRLACVAPGGCRGLVIVRLDGRTVGRASYSLRAGRRTTVRIRLAKAARGSTKRLRVFVV